MKKITFAGLALALALSGAPAVAQTYSPTATDNVYDFTGFGDVNLLTLFYNAMQDGRKYPTMEEFEAAGIQASDIAFVRSHVRRAEILSRADRLIDDTYETRNLFMNIPMDYGKDGPVGHPEAKFHADVYSMWQYTNLFGTWNKGFFQAPAAWVDAAHRNGTDMMSGIKFFDTTGGRVEGAGDYLDLIGRKNDDGSYMYVKPLIHILMFFGSDGINYNWEDTGYSSTDAVSFHKALQQYAKEVGFTNYHSAIYTSVSGLTSYYADALFGTTASGRTHDLMLNYANGDFSYQIATSVQAAETAFGTTEGLYTGVWIASMDRGWSRLNQGDSKRAGICLWGEHDQSRFWSFNAGDGPYDAQGNYQRLLERGFSGGNRNPLNRPAISDKGNNWVTEANADGSTKLPLSTFAGLATWIPERSAIQGRLPFATHFTLGNGDRYYYKGKNSFASEWYNMSAQDVVPTYRWLVLDAKTQEASSAINVNYTHLDAYTGGSCIELTGASNANGTDIVLYKTALNVTGSNPYAKVAVKTLKDVKATDLYLIVKVQGSDAWQEYAVGDVAGNTWEEKKISLGNVATSDVIERIGLRVKGNNNDYQLYVGKLEINDSRTCTPDNVKDLVAEVKQETKSSMSLKLYWDVDVTEDDLTRADWGLVYNDEADIDHFEILYKVGEDGRVSLVGTTASWAAFVGNIRFESVNDKPFIGVRSVSTDLKTYSPITWLEIPRAAQSELPDLVEEDSYGISQIDPSSNGIDAARTQRYVESVTTTGATVNLNYTASAPVADGTQYANARDHVLKVEQGQTINMIVKGVAGMSDGLQYCFGGGWIDWNCSGDFLDHPLPVERTAAEIAKGDVSTDPLGERVFFIGTHEASTMQIVNPGINCAFKVPEDATPGVSRLRMVFSDAWFKGAFNPTGLTNKGFTIDFTVEITGNNPGRVAPDTRDKGIADEPEGLNGDATNINDVEAGEVSEAVLEGDVINFSNVEKAWIYSADGRLVEFVKGNPTQVNAAQYAAGTYIVKMQYKNVMRSAKIVIK